MNAYLISLLLGIIEGLTEFLPVSSTAHLRIAEAVMGIDLQSGYWKMFTIVIQLGAILTLPIYFRKRLAEFAKTFPRGTRGDRSMLTHPATLTMYAFVVTAIPSLLLIKVIGKQLEEIPVMGWSLVVGGVVMWAVDAIYGGRPTYRTSDVDQMGVGQAVWVGACQILSAVFPGTSRSMATIAAGQTAGMSRQAALEFSFLLSIPTMVAATGYDLVKSLVGKHTEIGARPQNAEQWIALAIGFVVSFVVAYGVVAWFMAWVRKRGFVPFAVWRLALGVVVLAWAARLGG
jgi:undecaprenyl-diphosphatase